MIHSMVSGHIGGLIASLVLFLGASGTALYLLRQNFRKGEKGSLSSLSSLSKTKGKPKAKAAPSVVDAAPPEVAVAPLVQEPLHSESAPAELPVLPVLPTLNATPSTQNVPSRTYIVTSIHVSIWAYDRVLEKLDPDHAVEALNEFHSIGMSWAEKNHVLYERSSGGSFYLHSIDPLIAADALKCALELRLEFMEWNDVRKAQAYAPFIVVMGADRGAAIWGQIGPESHRQESIVGEVIARARALSQIALSLGSSILASEELWTTVSDRYLGERVARANLTAFDNLTSCYKVKGHITENGQEIWAKEYDSRLVRENAQIDAPRIEDHWVSSLWRVHNGSQILGPMSDREVAQALYSLEIDFDCECWKEGSTERMLIEKSGMFGNSAAPGASYWVFDGSTIHGPLSLESLISPQSRKQFPRESYVCEKSTVLGWKPLLELRASLHASGSALAAASAPAFAPAQAPVESAPALAPAPEPVLTSEPALTLAPEPAPELAPAFELAQPAQEPEEEPEIEIQAPVSPPAMVVVVPEPKAAKVTETQAEPSLAALTPAAPIDLPILMPVLEVAERPGKKSA